MLAKEGRFWEKEAYHCPLRRSCCGLHKFVNVQLVKWSRRRVVLEAVQGTREPEA